MVYEGTKKRIMLKHPRRSLLPTRRGTGPHSNLGTCLSWSPEKGLCLCGWHLRQICLFRLPKVQQFLHLSSWLDSVASNLLFSSESLEKLERAEVWALFSSSTWACRALFLFLKSSKYLFLLTMLFLACLSMSPTPGHLKRHLISKKSKLTYMWRKSRNLIEAKIMAEDIFIKCSLPPSKTTGQLSSA